MKKITFKITSFVMLAMFAFQGQAQVTEIVAGEKYSVQCVANGLYLKSGGESNAYEFSAALENDIKYDFFWAHHDSVDPGEDGELGTGDDVVHNYLDDWNIQNDFRGIMRAANPGTVHTNFKFKQSYNPNGGHKTDKRWDVTSSVVAGPAGDITVFRFSPLSDNNNGENANPDRFLYQAVDGTLINVSEADMEDAENANTDGALRSFWVLAESEVVLSAEEFDTSSIFISNPVNNELNIKGLTDNVSKVSVFNLLGSSVLTRNVAGQSSINLNVSALAAGMYIVKLEGDNGTFSKKIIKQ
jgi:hypothetical protein